MVVTQPEVVDGAIDIQRSGTEFAWELPEGGVDGGITKVEFSAVEQEPFFRLECEFDSSAGTGVLPAELVEQVVPSNPDIGFLFVAANVFHMTEATYEFENERVRLELSSWADVPSGEEFALSVNLVR